MQMFCSSGDDPLDCSAAEIEDYCKEYKIGQVPLENLEEAVKIWGVLGCGWNSELLKDVPYDGGPAGAIWRVPLEDEDFNSEWGQAVEEARGKAIKTKIAARHAWRQLITAKNMAQHSPTKSTVNRLLLAMMEFCTVYDSCSAAWLDFLDSHACNPTEEEEEEKKRNIAEKFAGRKPNRIRGEIRTRALLMKRELLKQGYNASAANTIILEHLKEDPGYVDYIDSLTKEACKKLLQLPRR